MPKIVNQFPRIIIVNDGKDLLLDRNGNCLTYFNLEELLLLKKKIQASIRFAKKNNIPQLNWEAAEAVRIDWEARDSHQAKKETKLRKGFIYLMIEKSSGCVKIGFSKNPKYRESTLLSQKPDIELIFKIEGTLNDEKLVHEKLSKYRVRGEWFNVSVDEAIKTINKIVQPLPF